MKVLVTGGAGFIGQHVTRHLLAAGHTTTVLDNFSAQVHGGRRELAEDIRRDVRLIVGDVCDTNNWTKALDGVEAVIHLAAETGTGQSMYEVSSYERVNLGGTAALCHLLANGAGKKVSRVVVASSRAVYGEGAYRCARDGIVYPRPRLLSDLLAGRFDPPCPVCAGPCETIATAEAAPFQPSSFYGLTKQAQEQMVVLFGQQLGIPCAALRYQNVYGPGQSLSNPYSGILAVFSNLARLDEPIRVFEDGLESRDFVYIDDVVEATVRAVAAPIQGANVINVGSGVRTTVADVARRVRDFHSSASDIRITGDFRKGDIRHNCASVEACRALLGFNVRWSLPDGLPRFLNWAIHQPPAAAAPYQRSLEELRKRGLMNAA